MLPVYEILEHTADLRIAVHGGDLARLCENAAMAMFAELSGGELPEPTLPPRQVCVSADGAELVLREWLAQLLFLHETEREFYTRFSVASADSQELRGEVAGVPTETIADRLAVEIKAVTYHGLRIEEHARGLRAEIIFDL